MNQTKRRGPIRYCPRCGLPLPVSEVDSAERAVCLCAGMIGDEPRDAGWSAAAGGTRRRALLARLQELFLLTSSHDRPRPRWLRPAWGLASLASVVMMVMGLVSQSSMVVVMGVALTGLSTAAYRIVQWQATRPARREVGTALETEIDQTRRRLADMHRPASNRRA